MRKFLLPLDLDAMASMVLTACGDGDKLDNAIDSYCGKISDYMGRLVSKSEGQPRHVVATPSLIALASLS